VAEHDLGIESKNLTFSTLSNEGFSHASQVYQSRRVAPKRRTSARVAHHFVGGIEPADHLSATDCECYRLSSISWLMSLDLAKGLRPLKSPEHGQVTMLQGLGNLRDESSELCAKNLAKGAPPLEIPRARPSNNVTRPRKSERRILRVVRQESRSRLRFQAHRYCSARSRLNYEAHHIFSEGGRRSFSKRRPQETQNEYLSDNWNCRGLNITLGAPKDVFGNGGPAAGQLPMNDVGFL
jgi:hypothetical protein